MRYLLLLFLSFQLCAADNNVNNVLDIKEIVKIAIENNPVLKAAKEKINQFEALRSLSFSTMYPTVSWILTGNYLKDAVYTGTPKFSGNPYNTYMSDLKLTQTVYAKGLFSANTVIDHDKKIQLSNIELQERALTQNVIEAFYRFILNQQNLEKLLKNQDIIQKALITSTQRYQKGRGQLLDVLQVKTQLALIQPQIENAKNQFEIAAQQLINYMGEKEHPGFKIKGELKLLRLSDVQKNIDLANYHLPEYEVNQLQLSRVDYVRDVTLGKDFPNVKLVGDYLYNNYKKADLFSDYSHAWAIQLQLTVPLFSGFSSNHESNSFVSERTQLRMVKKDLEDALSLKQVTSLKNLKTAETSLVSSESAVKLAGEAQNEAARLYKLSQIDFLQFLTVQQAALQAQLSFDSLKFKSIEAYSNYFVATGQPLFILIELLMKEGSKK